MTRLLLPTALASRLQRASLALALFALATTPAFAQIVFDDFNDGDTSNAGAFYGGSNGGAGTGPTTDRDGTDGMALNLGVDPGTETMAGGTTAFAGFSVEAPGMGVDATGAEYFTFYIRPTVNEGNGRLVVEVNLQEDANGDGTYDGATEDEYQANIGIDVFGGQPYTLVQLPISAFYDDNSFNVGSNDGFDFSRVKNVVIAMGGLYGPGFAVSFDDFAFQTAPIETAVELVSFDDFNDGDTSNAGAFYGGSNGGAGTGPTTDRDGTDGMALNLGVDPGTETMAGGTTAFAGFSVEAPGMGVDATGAEYFTFYIRPTVNEGNGRLVVEVNLQEDANGDGTYDGATEDEYQANIGIDVFGGQPYTLVQLPISAFYDDNSFNVGSNDGFDFSRVKNVVIAMGGLYGPGFAVSFDDFAFATAGDVARELPPVFAGAPVTFPNPTAGHATVTFDLATASRVSVDVIDLLGRRVATLADGPQAAGEVRLAVPTGTLAPGAYLVRVATEAGIASTRLTVVR